jgi:hypothetical protein
MFHLFRHQESCGEFNRSMQHTETIQRLDIHL